MMCAVKLAQELASLLSPAVWGVKPYLLIGGDHSLSTACIVRPSDGLQVRIWLGTEVYEGLLLTLTALAADDTPLWSISCRPRSSAHVLARDIERRLLPRVSA